jgi:hypothetical protein
MERVFDAPRDLVWKVITDPERITNLWGPHGYTTTVEEMDVRPGGRWRFIQHTTGGEDVPFKGEYLEVVPPERVVQTFIFDVEPFNNEAAITTVTLEDLGGSHQDDQPRPIPVGRVARGRPLHRHGRRRCPNLGSPRVRTGSGRVGRPQTCPTVQEPR